FTSGLAGPFIDALAVDPSRPAIVHAGTSAGAFSIEQPIDLTLTLADTPDPLAVGGSVTLGYTVRNAADVPAVNLALSTPIPAGTTFQAITPGSWSCATPSVGGTGTVSCTRSALPGGAQETVSVLVRAETPGTVTATGIVSGGGTDPDPSNNT